MVFSTLPTVAEGFQLKTWRGGPDSGKPKVSPVVQGLIDRGLMRLQHSQHLPRVFFTPAGLAELHAMMMDGRLADPKKFAHIRAELGIEPSSVALADQAGLIREQDVTAALAELCWAPSRSFSYILTGLSDRSASTVFNSQLIHLRFQVAIDGYFNALKRVGQLIRPARTRLMDVMV